MANPYRLLLVDDEEIIREGISRKINWEEEGFRLLTPCEDGESAIQVIQQEEPDVVITDICMPRVDGLEVAQYVMENYPDILVVILSGYEDFGYARKAVSLNVHEYLLKPLSSRKISELLKRIHQELDHRKAFNLDFDRLLSLQDESKQILLERFLCRLISGVVHKDELKSINNRLPSLKPEIKWFSVICFDVDDSFRKQMDGTISLDLFLLAMRELIEEVLSKMSASLICQPYESRLIVILGGLNEEDSLRTARFAGNQIHKSIQALPDFTVSAGIGTAYLGIENISKSFNEAITALENRMVVGDNSVLYYHKDQGSYPKNMQQFLRIQSSIRTSLRQQKEDEVTPLVHEFCSLLKNSGLSVSRIRLEIDKLAFSLIDFIDNLFEGGSGSVNSEISEQLAVLSRNFNIIEVEESLNRLLMQISQELKEKRRNYPEVKVRDIQNYLKENLALKDLTVDSITNRFFISPSYLSKLFKQFTGNTFIEYLTEIRVARACELLKTTNRKLFEISEMVGYADSGYFTSIFKKYRGVTMSQYREQL